MVITQTVRRCLIKKKVQRLEKYHNFSIDHFFWIQSHIVLPNINVQQINMNFGSIYTTSLGTVFKDEIIAVHVAMGIIMTSQVKAVASAYNDELSWTSAGIIRDNLLNLRLYILVNNCKTSKNANIL